LAGASPGGNAMQGTEKSPDLRSIDVSDPALARHIARCFNHAERLAEALRGLLGSKTPQNRAIAKRALAAWDSDAPPTRPSGSETQINSSHSQANTT